MHVRASCQRYFGQAIARVLGPRNDMCIRPYGAAQTTNKHISGCSRKAHFRKQKTVGSFPPDNFHLLCEVFGVPEFESRKPSPQDSLSGQFSRRCTTANSASDGSSPCARRSMSPPISPMMRRTTGSCWLRSRRPTKRMTSAAPSTRSALANAHGSCCK